MTTEADKVARKRALIDLDSTLLVEAAAGTGKTAIIAGRVTMLLAQGVAPKNIAAITFTEFAASELAARVQRYVADLLRGETPKPMQTALPSGLNEAQRANLSAARAHIDELTASTIHAFCQGLIRDYAVEAHADPGAQILDRVQMEAAIDAVFDRWVKRRLSFAIETDDAVAALSKEDPLGMVESLRELARFRLEHRRAQAPGAAAFGRPDTDFKAAVEDFRAWFESQPQHYQAWRLLEDFDKLAAFYDGKFETPPTFDALWRMNNPPRVPSMARDVIELSRPAFKEKWDKAVAKDGGAPYADLLDHFDRADRGYRNILGLVARALATALSRELDDFLADYAAFKRNAAVLDFQDLLDGARHLVCSSEDARKDIGARFTHILVDEFQDTDPTQSEILFSIAAKKLGATWTEHELRPGALFMVGDPKQAIYRFRGADIGAYEQARDVLEKQSPDAIVRITANFRSRPDILTYVNARFEVPLSAEGQPGYVALTPTMAESDQPCAIQLPIGLQGKAKAQAVREAEAKAVAGFCAKIIGAMQISDGNGGRRVLRAGDIALLTPQKTKLWIYENALAAEGLPFASQAGKGLFRRQEAQDLVALARALADHRDTLAFGALLRGPVVGLTQNEILDIAAALPPDGDVIQDYTIRTKPEHIIHPEARRVQTLLRELRRRAHCVTPTQILSEAIERLDLRPILAARGGERAARALANVEAFIELARPYAVRGLKRFASDMGRCWRNAASFAEGPLDSEGDAIELVTVHSSKGLEWPVVVPINMVTQVPPIERFVVADNTIHWIEKGAAAPELLQLFRSDAEASARERLRHWYVACTRAEELLVLPHIVEPRHGTWASVVPLGQDALPELVLEAESAEQAADKVTVNMQTADDFERQKQTIAEVSAPPAWLRPSDEDDDRVLVAAPAIASDAGETSERPLPVGAGRIRGLILHKLLEEVLTGETPDVEAILKARAAKLLAQLMAEAKGDSTPPEPDELGATVWRTLRLPAIEELRPSLRSECALYGAPDERTLLSGRADAVAFAEGAIAAVLDWKSDVNPSAESIAAHSGQIRTYMHTLACPRGALVYMTSGDIVWLET